jgi:uncharacterized protein
VGPFVGLLLVHLHFPDAGSLKAKRKDLRSIKEGLRGRLGVAVSEVGGQDTWQRSTLAVALTAQGATAAEHRADEVERWVLARWPEGVRVERAVASFEEAGGIG